MTGSLDDELLRNETQEVDLYINKYSVIFVNVRLSFIYFPFHLFLFYFEFHFHFYHFGLRQRV